MISDATAQKDYGVSRDFVAKGIEAGQLEYREGSSWGNPWFKFLRSQLERYIGAQLGPEHLASAKAVTELREVSKAISGLRRKLAVLEAREAELQRAVRTWRTPRSHARRRWVRYAMRRPCNDWRHGRAPTRRYGPLGNGDISHGRMADRVAQSCTDAAKTSPCTDRLRPPSRCQSPSRIL